MIQCLDGRQSFSRTYTKLQTTFDPSISNVQNVIRFTVDYILWKNSRTELGVSNYKEASHVT